MKTIFTLWLGGLWGVLLAFSLDAGQTDRIVRNCRSLNSVYPGTVSFPGSLTYTTENANFWSVTTSGLKPSCVFLPTTAKQLAEGVKICASTNTTFAVRGCGHMPIPGYANTNDGIFIALTKLNDLTLSRDKSVVSVGPGRTWGEVYRHLQPEGLVVVGGRVGVVGVAGLILGGGVSFYSNQFGFAADNVVAFEVVLAGGRIVTATARQEPDLFWALKGGANSFGIVTRFDLRTYSSPKVCIGDTHIMPMHKDEFLSALASFAKDGSKDSKAAIIPGLLVRGGNLSLYTSTLFYDSDDGNCDQPALAEFNAIPAVTNSYAANSTVAAYLASTEASFPRGTRWHFQTVSSYANSQALKIIHDTLLEMVQGMANVTAFQMGVNFQPATRKFIVEGIKNGGNPQAVDPGKAPYFWPVFSFSWVDPSDDEHVIGLSEQITAEINIGLAAAGQKAAYLYLNGAGPGQQVFQGYGHNSVDKLYEVRSRYDPDLVFTRLLPGGWKLPDRELVA